MSKKMKKTEDAEEATEKATEETVMKPAKKAPKKAAKKAPKKKAEEATEETADKPAKKAPKKAAKKTPKKKAKEAIAELAEEPVEKAPKKAPKKKAEEVAEEAAEEPAEEIPVEPEPHVKPDLMLFGKWDSTEVEIKDVGLARYISLKPVLLPHTSGRHAHKRFHKSQVPIVERFVNKLLNAGRRKDKRTRTGRNAGKKLQAINALRRVFEMIDYRTGLNPIQVLVTAIENSAPAEETTRISYGGMAYPRSVDVSPQRRIDLALKYLAVGATRSAHKNAKSFEECLIDELLLAYKGDSGSFAIARKEERERVARSAR
jgi:small subunit ribosomal protein S7